MSKGHKGNTSLEREEYLAKTIPEMRRRIIDQTLVRIRRYKTDLDERRQMQERDIDFLKKFIQTGPMVDEFCRQVLKEIDSLK